MSLDQILIGQKSPVVAIILGLNLTKKMARMQVSAEKKSLSILVKLHEN